MFQEFNEGARLSLIAFENFIAAHSPQARADHLCFRCASSAEFEMMRAMLEPESVFVYQSIISSRWIAIIKLRNAFATSLGPISVIELSDQKPDGSQVSGFDHIEIYPTTGSEADLVASMRQTGAEFNEVVRPHHTTFDMTLPGGFKIRIEAEPLIDKIKREEMKV